MVSSLLSYLISQRTTRLAVQRPQPNVLFQQASQTVRGTSGLTNGQLNTSTHNST